MATTLPATAIKAAKTKMITKLVQVERAPKMGKKKIFLPNFVITFLRTPEKPSTTASFIVPLNMHKLDLRDYLWNGYGLRVLGVRSFIQQQKLRQDKPGALRPAQRKWYRPRAIKKMMIEMEQPFAWPPEPDNYDLWDREMQSGAKKDQEEWQATLRPDAKEKPTKERDPMELQAQEYLQGKRKWMAYQEEIAKEEISEEEWEDVGEEREVDIDVKVPRS